MPRQLELLGRGDQSLGLRVLPEAHREELVKLYTELVIQFLRHTHHHEDADASTDQQQDPESTR